MADEKKEGEWKEGAIVEISNEKLKKLLESAELEIGRDIRLVKGLEIRPGSLISKQYDR